MPITEFDVFFSYARADAAEAAPVHAALSSAGIRVWIDEQRIEEFESITSSLRDGLARCKCLLAFYSKTYPTRRICQWELTAAFLAGQAEGDPRRRVLVANPTSSHTHIQPIELRDALFADPTALDDVVAAVRKHLQKLTLTMGEILRHVSPPWLPLPPMGWPRFIGRIEQLWAVHSQLQLTTTVGSHGVAAPNVAQVRGLGGVGKSLLVEEFALRFGPAYAGGVFWFRAPEKPSSTEQRESRHRQVRRVAERCGIDVATRSPDFIMSQLVERISSKAAPCLWVVDGLPSGLSSDELREWMGPHPLCHTVFTTRSRKYSTGSSQHPPIDLDVLPLEDALAIINEHKAIPDADVPLATKVAMKLGCHALACEVVGAWAAIASIQHVSESLENEHEDALVLAADFADELPHGQQPNVSALLLASVRELSRFGRLVLRLAALLAPAEPIPSSLFYEVLVTQDLDRDAVDKALHEAQSRSLARASEAGWLVHSLVRRAIRFDLDGTSTKALRLAAARALERILADVADPGAFSVLHHYVAHAADLFARPRSALEARVLGWVARYQSEAGRYEHSLQTRRRVIALQEFLLGRRHPDTLRSMHERGAMLSETGRASEAEPLLREALCGRLANHGIHHQDTLTTLSVLTSAIAKLGRRDLALESKLFQVRSEALGPLHPDTLNSLNSVGESLFSMGVPEKSADLCERILPAAEEICGPEHPSTLTIKFNLAMSKGALRQLGPATKLMTEVLATRRRVLPEGHPHTRKAEEALALLRKLEAGTDVLELLRELNKDPNAPPA